MKKLQAIQALKTLDAQGVYVFSLQDLRKLFPGDSDKTFSEGLRRLVSDGLLVRALRAVYVNPYALSFDGYTLEHIAKTLHRGEYNYVSLESILSEYGAISQIPIDRLTVMTTGRSGTYQTPYGTIEFTHTKRPTMQIINAISSVEKRPLRVASKAAAWRDLKRVGRNTEMIDMQVINED